jgi:hypothetical protein
MKGEFKALPFSYNPNNLSKENLYWTFLLLTPLGWNPYYMVPSSPHALPLNMVSAAFKHAVDFWEEITRHLNHLLSDDDDAVLDPHKHDPLTFDDSSFSRSRCYFWATNILETFPHTIENMLKQWEY